MAGRSNRWEQWGHQIVSSWKKKCSKCFGLKFVTSSSCTLSNTAMQPRLYLWMYMSQTFMLKHNYHKRGTFKIYCSFCFTQANFQWSEWGTFTLASTSLVLKQEGLRSGPPLLSYLLGHTRGSTLCLPWWQRPKDSAPMVSSSKAFIPHITYQTLQMPFGVSHKVLRRIFSVNE